MQSKIFNLSNKLKKPIDQIKEYCIDLKSGVQLATELAIQQMNAHSQDFVFNIEKYQNDCIKAYEKSNAVAEVNASATGMSRKNAEASTASYLNFLNELEQFSSDWTEYLARTTLKDEDIHRANRQASRLHEKADQFEISLNHSIFNGSIVKFVQNPVKLDSALIGFLTIQCVKSNIATQEQMKNLMRLCSFPLDQRWQLLYRASQDGFEAADFHDKCDNKPNTLVVIKSTNGNVFGGYTEKNWNGNEIAKKDESAFLFSLINKKGQPLFMRCQKADQAIFCSKSSGPTFGGGRDIYICDRSNEINVSYTNLGSSFKHPEFAHKSDEAKSFLAGTFIFKTSEIEVFTKIMK